MNELEFRRRIYADPDSRDEALLQHATANEKDQKFWQETRMLNEKIKHAVDVPVPDDLADKLIFQSTFKASERPVKRSRLHLAVAASVAMMVGLSLTLWSPSRIDLGNAALAHMAYTDSSELAGATQVSLTQVNEKLDDMGAQLIGDIGEIVSANFCRLDFVKSLHVIVKSSDGPVSIFFAPNTDKTSVPAYFADEEYQGSGFAAQRANIMVVGANSAIVAELANTIKANVIQAS